MVVRVWGKADSFELVFSRSRDCKWQAVVPTDLEDGQYAVELYCEDKGGSQAYWTGMLYLNKSESVEVYIVSDTFKIWLVSEGDVEMNDDIHIWLIDEDEGGENMLHRDFILGERKYIKLEATSCEDLPVVITGARYELAKGGEVVDSGDCLVDEHRFMALIQPQEVGDYMFTATYTVAPETRKVKVAIHVT